MKVLLDASKRTGLAGFLWDSVSNLGWWQLDYSQGTMRPQYDRFAQLWASLQHAGLYIQPEGLVSFSTHSCCGLHGGNVYAGELLGYSYNTAISMDFQNTDQEDSSSYEMKLLRGDESVDMLFQYLAHKRVPPLTFHRIPREEWHEPTVAEIKRVLELYRSQRQRMIRRTVLKKWLGRALGWWRCTGALCLFQRYRHHRRLRCRHRPARQHLAAEPCLLVDRRPGKITPAC